MFLYCLCTVCKKKGVNDKEEVVVNNSSLLSLSAKWQCAIWADTTHVKIRAPQNEYIKLYCI